MFLYDWPKIAVYLIEHCDAWVVGSAANPDAKPRDIDLIIPWPKWLQAATYIAIEKNVRPNTFGGWKVSTTSLSGNDIDLDVWPDDLSSILSKSMSKYIWHPKSDTRWKKEN